MREIIWTGGSVGDGSTDMMTYEGEVTLCVGTNKTKWTTTLSMTRSVLYQRTGASATAASAYFSNMCSLVAGLDQMNTISAPREGALQVQVQYNDN